VLNTLYLHNDGDTVSTPATLGTAGSLSNSQCSLNVGASTVSGSGNNLTLNVVLTFTPAFAGTKSVYMAAINSSNVFSGWAAKGTWTAPPLTPVSVVVSPSSASLVSTGTQQFIATVSGSTNTNVTWSLNPLVGQISTAGLYTAPTKVSSAQMVSVTATSQQDSSKSANATITLTPPPTPVSVVVSPGSASLVLSGTQQFVATVNGSTNTNVTWSLNPLMGQISTAGLYTAPATVSVAQMVSVTATSQHASKSASATITLVQDSVTSSVTSLISPAKFCDPLAGYPAPAICNAPQEIPLGSFPVPPVGGSYLDPNFGGTVRVVAANVMHPYSTPTSFSATAKYALVLSNDGWASVVETATGSYKSKNLLPTGDMRWDAVNDEVLYTVTGSKIFKRILSAESSTLLVDYSTDSHHFSSINMGGTGDLSKDNWLAFWADQEHQVCALNLARIITYCADYKAPTPGNRVGWNFIDYALITKGPDSHTGKRYVLLMADPAFGMYSVDEAAGRLNFELRSPEVAADMMGYGNGNNDGICDPNESCITTPHSDVMEDFDGQQYLVYLSGTNSPCQANFSTLQLNKGLDMLMSSLIGGGRKDAALAFKCGLTWSSYHVGCAKSAPYCVWSIDSPAANLPTQMRNGTEPYFGEVIIMRGNGVEFRRIAMHRSVLWGFWDQPRACISNDGRYALWDTNFGRADARWVVMAYTGY
jgi:hypothetical protein